MDRLKSKNIYKDELYKNKIISILKDDFKLEKDEILDFLMVSNSTYNKMVSSTNRELPKKSICMFEKMFYTNNWEEIIKKLKENEEYVRKRIILNRFHIQKSEEEVKNPQEKVSKTVKNMNFISSFIENEEIQKMDEKDLELLANFAKTKRFAKNMRSYVNLIRFQKDGKKEGLSDEDIYFIGFINAMHFNEKLKEEIYNYGSKRVKVIEEKIKQDIDLLE